MRQLEGRKHVTFILPKSLAKVTEWMPSVMFFGWFYCSFFTEWIGNILWVSSGTWVGWDHKGVAAVISGSPVSVLLCCAGWRQCANVLKPFFISICFWSRMWETSLSLPEVIWSVWADGGLFTWVWTGHLEQEFKSKLRTYVEHATVLNQANAF